MAVTVWLILLVVLFAAQLKLFSIDKKLQEIKDLLRERLK